MKSGYSSNFKNCVTCACWTGARSLNSTRTRAEYDSGVTGNCVEGSSTIRYRNKSPSASCSKWEKWGQLKSTNSSNRNSSTSSRSKKGIIPYPVFVALILLVAIVQFALKNLTYVISIGIIVIVCSLVCFFLYRKAENPKKKIILTILVGIALIIGVLSIVPSIKKGNLEAQLKQSESVLQIINSTTVLGGYKPCFGTGNRFSNLNKIVIYGAIEYNSINNIFNVGYAEDQEKYARDLTPTKHLSLDRLSAKNYFNSNDINLNNPWIFPYYGIILLSKKDNVYLLDDIIQYDRYNFSDLNLDNWILKNADK